MTLFHISMEAVVKDIQGVQRHQECVWKGLRGEDCTFMTRCTVVLIFPPWYNNCFASDESQCWQSGCWEPVSSFAFVFFAALVFLCHALHIRTMRHSLLWHVCFCIWAAPSSAKNRGVRAYYGAVNDMLHGVVSICFMALCADVCAMCWCTQCLNSRGFRPSDTQFFENAHVSFSWVCSNLR